MAVNIGSQISMPLAKANIDIKYGPYDSVEAAFSALGPDGMDCLASGLTVGIKNSNGEIREYWFKEIDAIRHEFDLIEKQVDDYNSLKNKPTSLSSFNNDVGYITATDIPEVPVKSVAGKIGDVALSKSDVNLENVDNVKQYSAENEPPYPVTSVNNQQGDVVLSFTKTDIGLSNVDNTSDSQKATDLANPIGQALESKVEKEQGKTLIEESKISAYDSHVSDMNNPHNVTRDQLDVYSKNEIDLALGLKQGTISASNKISADNVRDDDTNNKFVSLEEKAIWNNKQDRIYVDDAPTTSSGNPVSSNGVAVALSEKVDKQEGKGLSTNDYTTAEKSKLSGIEAGAQKNVITGVKGENDSDFKTGDVVISKFSLGLDNVDNTSDQDKVTDTDNPIKIALDRKFDASNVVDNVTTEDSTKALSAKMGKELKAAIDNISSRGRYLSIWNANTGLPVNNPLEDNYEYRNGDYFIVGDVDEEADYPEYNTQASYAAGDKCTYTLGGVKKFYIANKSTGSGAFQSSDWDEHTIVNYRPSGNVYKIDTPSTEAELETVNTNDTYYFVSNTAAGTEEYQWIISHNSAISVTFKGIAGSPSDNNNLQGVLNTKVDKIAGKELISTSDYTNLTQHIAKTSGNPHNVTAADVGLGSVVNAGQSSATTEDSTNKAYFTSYGAGLLKNELKTYADDKVNALYLTKVGSDSSYITSVSQTDGKLSATFQSKLTAIGESDKTSSALPTTKAVVDYITSTIDKLDKTSEGSDGYYIKTVSQANGIVAAGKQAFNTDIKTSGDNTNAPTSGAVRDYVSTTISGLTHSTSGSGSYVTNVTETAGKVTVTKGNLPGATKDSYGIVQIGNNIDVSSSIISVKDSTTGQKGVVKLQNSIDTTTTTAVTPGAVKTELDKKVDKVSGKGLSTNDYTTAEKSKLSGIEAGAQKNVITGVKGNAESTYRTGNVNITPNNIGAVSTASGQGLSYTQQENARLNIGVPTLPNSIDLTFTGMCLIVGEEAKSNGANSNEYAYTNIFFTRKIISFSAGGDLKFYRSKSTTQLTCSYTSSSNPTASSHQWTAQKIGDYGICIKLAHDSLQENGSLIISDGDGEVDIEFEV